jgi:small-conductance mechanosensitive channel
MLEKEREALVAQLTRTLNDESATISSMAGELRTTLQAGTETSNAIHAALETVERITTQFQPKPGEAISEEKKPPFDIRQYTEMLKQATAASQELQALAGRADAILPALRSATAEAAGRGTELLNHLFLLLAALILIAVTATLGAALVYRRIARRT